jgi:hypothetical protein
MRMPFHPPKLISPLIGLVIAIVASFVARNLDHSLALEVDDVAIGAGAVALACLLEDMIRNRRNEHGS